MSATQTPEIARSDIYTDTEALIVAAQKIAELRATIQRMGAVASNWAGRAAGTKGFEQGFTALAAMAEDGLRDA